MHNHQWSFHGKVIKIIDGNSLIIWVDLGFETWKRVMVRFNRIRAKDTKFNDQGKESEPTETSKYLEQNLKGKNAYFQIFKKKVYNGFDKYFAEVFIKSGDIQLRIIDVNKCFNSSNRLDGYVNFNDILVNQGLATYLQFKEKNHD